MDIEHRLIDFQQSALSCSETRDDSGKSKRTISGYAAVFNSLSVNLGGFREKITRGTFADSLEKRSVIGLWSHNPDMVLSNTENKTLDLSEDEHGLRFEMLLDDDYISDMAYKRVSRRDVAGVSFGFRALEDDWAYDANNDLIRTLTKVSLIEISPTAFPAYPATAVSARSYKDVLHSGLAKLGNPADFQMRKDKCDFYFNACKHTRL